MQSLRYDKPCVTQADPFVEARTALAGTIFADIRYKPETESTNADALTLLEQPERNSGVTIVTDFQTHGRGRRGREWIAAPSSGLLFTTILPISLDASTLWSVPFWCGLAVKEALSLHRVDTALQWPNDLLLDKKKVAGILCVSRGVGTRAWAAWGVGINVTRTGDAAYAEIEPSPAFLSDVVAVNRAELLTTILQQFAKSLRDLDNATQIARRWQSAANLRGTPYRILIDGKTQPIDAVAQRLGEQGALVVRINGEEREIAFADARVLR